MPSATDSIIRQLKETVDIVSLIGQYLQLHRIGNRFKALCPFHDDKNPSMEVNPQRQSYKCWSCGAGGDCIEFVRQYERVEFPEAIRILADRVGIILDSSKSFENVPKGPAKSDIYRVLSWAAGFYRDSLGDHPEAIEYAQGRGISQEFIEKFGLGYSPADSARLKREAKTIGFTEQDLEASGIMANSEGRTYDRFHDRLIFPILDFSGRVVGFGGRILPAREQALAEQGRRTGKYINSPETAVFQKRKLVYAGDLARTSAREEKQVVVMEGYTDVIAAHQAGLSNVVGTLGTALGSEHIPVLRQLADKVVLIFDGDEAGQKAAERSLEIFLGQPVDLSLVALPDGMDPCDFLHHHGAEDFRKLIASSIDPLQFAIDRAEARFDLQNTEQARQAAEWVMSIFARIPRQTGSGLEMKVAMALDRLAFRLRIPTAYLQREWKRQTRETSRRNERKAEPEIVASESVAIRPDPLERELVELLLNHPELVCEVMPRVLASELRHPTLRMITQAIYDTFRAGDVPEFDRVVDRLKSEDQSYAAGLLQGIDTGPLREGVAPAEGRERLTGILSKFARRSMQDHIAELRRALADVDSTEDPETHLALQLEIRRLLAHGLPALGSAFSPIR
ncbi:MAG: DNA primase [Planctomycetota bacterium]|nr:DNA primase [Planctomycetota bacterium]